MPRMTTLAQRIHNALGPIDPKYLNPRAKDLLAALKAFEDETGGYMDTYIMRRNIEGQITRDRSFIWKECVVKPLRTAVSRFLYQGQDSDIRHKVSTTLEPCDSNRLVIGAINIVVEVILKDRGQEPVVVTGNLKLNVSIKQDTSPERINEALYALREKMWEAGTLLTASRRLRLPAVKSKADD